jgi:hypothetical protein
MEQEEVGAVAFITEPCGGLAALLRRNKSGHRGLSQMFSKTGRRPMKIAMKIAEKTVMKKATLILAGAMALTMLGSAALAQQALSGTVTKVNRINGTIVIQPPSGTVGANTGGGASAGSGANTVGAAEEYKVQDGLSLEDWHAGDQVAFSVTSNGPVKTITKLQKQ